MFLMFQFEFPCKQVECLFNPIRNSSPFETLRDCLEFFQFNIKSLDKFYLCQGARQLAKDLDFFIRWRCIEPERPIEIGAVRSKSRPRRQLLAQFLQQDLLYYTASTTFQYIY